MAGFLSGIVTLDSELFTTSSGNNNDVGIMGSLVYVNVSNNNDAITGITTGLYTEGCLILVVNIGPSNFLVLKNNDSNSLATNRIITADGNDYILPPFNTAILGYDTSGQMWHVLRVPDVTLSSYQASPSNPTGTTNTTGVMMGLAGSITPMKSGKVLAIISANMANGNSGAGSKMQIRYGTGSAPANAAALTGTAAGNLSQIVNAALALLVPGSANANCNAIISGLTLGTAYWFDLSLGSITGGTSTVTNISISLVEL